MKSVTDCFKRGLVLSATALAPENCLALFPRATHLIKHARFSCSPDPSHLSFFHSMTPLSLSLPHSHRYHQHAAGPRVCTRVCTYTYVRTRTQSALYVPVLFSFPFLLVTLQHLSLILVPLSSFVVNESLYLRSSSLSSCVPYGFFSPFLACRETIPRPLSIPLEIATAVASFSLSDILLPTRG